MKYGRLARSMSTALAFAFAFMVFSFSFAPKAHAVEYEGQIQYGWWRATTLDVFTGNLPIINSDPSSSSLSKYYEIRPYIMTMPNVEFTGAVKIYASFSPVPLSGTTLVMAPSDDFLNPSGWTVSYINSYSQTAYVESGLTSIDTFANSAAYQGKGYAIEASWQANEALPIRSLGIVCNSPNGFQMLTDGSGGWNLIYNSIRVITSEYTAEMEALDGVADAIISQNEILTALKGDLVAICQDIYQMTGDIYIAQNLLNSYVSQLVEKVTAIDVNTAEILRLLNTQLAALEVAINANADAIEAAIAAQTAAMIAYLDSVLNTGNEVPDDTYQQQQDAENILDQMESLEKPNVDTIVPEIGDYTDSGVSGVLSAIFSSNLIVTMMTLSASFAFGAYVLFGKRE